MDIRKVQKLKGVIKNLLSQKKMIERDLKKSNLSEASKIFIKGRKLQIVYTLADIDRQFLPLLRNEITKIDLNDLTK